MDAANADNVPASTSKSATDRPTLGLVSPDSGNSHSNGKQKKAEGAGGIDGIDRRVELAEDLNDNLREARPMSTSKWCHASIHRRRNILTATRPSTRRTTDGAKHATKDWQRDTHTPEHEE